MKILTPEEWITKVQGKSAIDHIIEEGVQIWSLLQFMEWYAEYVIKKSKELNKNNPKG